MSEIKPMAVESGGFGIVQDRLVRDWDLKNIPEYHGSLSGAHGERYMEGQDKADNVQRVMNFVDRYTGRFWGDCFDVFWLEMIFPVLITELELR